MQGSGNGGLSAAVAQGTGGGVGLVWLTAAEAGVAVAQGFGAAEKQEAGKENNLISKRLPSSSFYKGARQPKSPFRYYSEFELQPASHTLVMLITSTLQLFIRSLAPSPATEPFHSFHGRVSEISKICFLCSSYCRSQATAA